MSEVIWKHQPGGTYDEGVALCSEDLDRIDKERLAVDTVDLDDGQVVPIDAERVVRVARDRNETEAVATRCQYVSFER